MTPLRFKPANIWQVFTDRAATLTDHPAIIRGEETVSFGALEARARQYAAELDRIGVSRNARVIIRMDGSSEMAAAILGVWAMGGVAALLAPTEPPAHLHHAIATIAPRCIITPAEAPALGDVPVRVLLTGDVKADPGEARPRPALPSDPASIIFTSGSTGRPKGVTHCHRNLIQGCRAVGAYTGFRPDERILCTIPWAFDYGYNQFLTTSIMGLTQILPVQLNPFGMCEAITAHRPTFMPIIPSLITYLIQGISPFRTIDTSSLRIFANSGGTIPGPVLKQLMEMRPDASVFLNFGLTESYRTAGLDPSLVSQRPDSIGKAFPGVEIILVRQDGSIIEGPGEVGQLVHRGDYTFMGYWNNPEATAKALRPDPLADPDCPDARRALFTGDLARRDEEGFLYFEGRIDHQIKSMGVRVAPGEVEEILHASGLVKEVGVFGVPHQMMGHEVWAAVVPADAYSGEDITVDLTSYARASMSPYMIPRQFMVFSEPLPKTRSGKTNYPALREAASGPD